MPGGAGWTRAHHTGGQGERKGTQGMSHMQQATSQLTGWRLQDSSVWLIALRSIKRRTLLGTSTGSPRTGFSVSRTARPNGMYMGRSGCRGRAMLWYMAAYDTSHRTRMLAHHDTSHAYRPSWCHTCFREEKAHMHGDACSASGAGRSVQANMCASHAPSHTLRHRASMICRLGWQDVSCSLTSSACLFVQWTCMSDSYIPAASHR